MNKMILLVLLLVVVQIHIKFILDSLTICLASKASESWPRQVH